LVRQAHGLGVGLVKELLEELDDERKGRRVVVQQEHFPARREPRLGSGIHFGLGDRSRRRHGTFMLLRGSPSGARAPIISTPIGSPCAAPSPFSARREACAWRKVSSPSSAFPRARSSAT